METKILSFTRENGSIKGEVRFYVVGEPPYVCTFDESLTPDEETMLSDSEIEGLVPQRIYDSLIESFPTMRLRMLRHGEG